MFFWDVAVIKPLLAINSGEYFLFIFQLKVSFCDHFPSSAGSMDSRIVLRPTAGALACVSLPAIVINAQHRGIKTIAFFPVPQEQDSVTLQFLTNSFTLTKKNVQRKLTYTPVCRGAVVEKQSSRVRPVTEAHVTGKVSRGDLLTRRDSRNRPLTSQPLS